MPESRVALPDRGIRFNVRVNGGNRNFLLESDKIQRAALKPLDPLMADLLDIAATIFAADGQVTRGGPAGSGMGQDWCRRFQFTIPVRMIDIWIREDVTNALRGLVGFMSGDAPSFEFTPRPLDAPAEPFLDFEADGAAFQADEVILFSGGLDSFAGALETLSTGTGNVLLVSHRSAQKVLPRQDNLARSLMDRFKGRCLHIGVRGRLVGLTTRETTQRSRTLLFAALAHAVASSFGSQRIRFFENGIVSHNLPISPQVIGTMATRTTHPLVLKKLNDLISLIAPDAPRITNGYQWLTKRDVIERIRRHEAEKWISTAVSCAIVREQTILEPHCGCCSQCLDRRFAILSAGLAAHDALEGYKTDVLMGPTPAGKSRIMAVEWARHALSFRDMDIATFMQRFGVEATHILQGHPDLEPRQVIERTLEMHRHHGDDIFTVMEAAIRDHAAEIADRRIDPTSLLMLHIGNGTAEGPWVPKPDDRPAIPAIDDLPEEDFIPAPDAPLTAAFFMEDERPVVAVKGLCRVEGAPARVAHLLKPAFDEDRASGLSPADHKYVLVHVQPGCTMSKEQARQNIRRCRKILSDAFSNLHGHAPPGNLLLQSKSSQGVSHRSHDATCYARSDQLARLS